MDVFDHPSLHIRRFMYLCGALEAEDTEQASIHVRTLQSNLQSLRLADVSFQREALDYVIRELDCCRVELDHEQTGAALSHALSARDGWSAIYPNRKR